MKIKRKKNDIIFSQLVRERAKWLCASCGVNKSNEPDTFDCAHIMGRRSVGLRWHPDNAIGLCRGCHIFYTSHPFDWADFCKAQFGEERIAELRRVSNEVVKWSPKVREEIYQFMKAQQKAGTFDRHPLMYAFKE